MPRFSSVPDMVNGPDQLPLRKASPPKTGAENTGGSPTDSVVTQEPIRSGYCSPLICPMVW